MHWILRVRQIIIINKMTRMRNTRKKIVIMSVSQWFTNRHLFVDFRDFCCFFIIDFPFSKMHRKNEFEKMSKYSRVIMKKLRKILNITLRF